MNTRGRLDLSDRGQRTACAALALLLTLLLLAAGAFEPLEQRLGAWRAAFLDRAPTDELAIVEIDARSLAMLPGWPWSRRYHAQVIRQLHREGAAMIAFDVDFSATSDAAGDRAFARALREAEPVILPVFEQQATSRIDETVKIRSKPAPLFDPAWIGGVNIFPGGDGVVRDYPAALMIGGQIQPSIAVLLAESDGMSDRLFQPDWSIDVRRIPHFSFVDVLAGRVPAKDIAGKRILIGATAVELGDRYTIPRFGMVPGVVVQALAADSLLQGRAMVRSATMPMLGGLLIIISLLGAVNSRCLGWGYAARAILVLAALLAMPIIVQARWPLSLDTVPLLFAGAACIVGRVSLEAHRRARQLKLHDLDTGLPNRRALESALEPVDGQTPALAAIAIERFDLIRDAIGANALAKVVFNSSGRLEESGCGTIYRVAPDVLAWTLRQDADAGETSIAIAERFRGPIETDEGPVDVGVTLGVDAERGIGPGLRIERALAAIGSARSANLAWQSYSGADPSLKRQLSLMGDLRRGMACGEVSIAYQPKLNLRTGWIDSAEVLVRWQHPTEGAIPPDRFVPLAESTGVIHELTEFVLRAAVADGARWADKGRSLCVAVNVSAMDISEEGFADKVRRTLSEFDLKPSLLALEITESAIIRSPAAAMTTLTSLRALGVCLSIDDYGTGQSTLSYLKKLPVHELKIDQSFVTGLIASTADQIMVRSTIDLAHELQLTVVAEGIEDQPTLKLLTRMGCDYAQGYYVGRPIGFDQMTVRLLGQECQDRDAS
ncbi:MAG: EAL domain-containing protein [Pseudomonadota bacterium]|nr:EAL domain-containing protein [Pseudomonadota bacterium]